MTRAAGAAGALSSARAIDYLVIRRSAPEGEDCSEDLHELATCFESRADCGQRVMHMTMATKGILQSTFPIRTSKGNFTGFTTTAGRVRYLITAAHMVDGDTESVSVYFDGRWNTFPVSEIRRALDIAVIPLHPTEEIEEPIPAGSEGMVLGEEIQFFGFPHALPWDVSELPRSERLSIPVVKRGVIAATFFGGAVSGGNFDLVLDAVAWPGFSGSPIVVSRPKDSDAKVKVMGIVTGLSYPEAPSEECNNLVRAGFVQACKIDSALSLLKA